MNKPKMKAYLESSAFLFICLVIHGLTGPPLEFILARPKVNS
jgi:hypothetical protein